MISKHLRYYGIRIYIFLLHTECVTKFRTKFIYSLVRFLGLAGKQVKMNLYTCLLQLIIVSGAYFCVSFGKSYQSDDYHTRRHQFDKIPVKISDNETTKKEIIAKLNDTEAAALAEVMQKEPKFFDEFERKLI